MRLLLEAGARLTGALPKSGDIDESSLAPHRAGVSLPPDVVQLVHHILVNDTPHVSLAKHAPFDLPVVNETFITSPASSILFVFARKVLWVVPVARI
jgi:riboflavin biosynthesis pyrimidine reductase